MFIFAISLSLLIHNIFSLLKRSEVFGGPEMKRVGDQPQGRRESRKHSVAWHGLARPSAKNPAALNANDVATLPEQRWGIQMAFFNTVLIFPCKNV